MKRKGAALIEMAAVLLVMGPLTAGAFQYGRAFWILHALEDAVREGARQGAANAEGAAAVARRVAACGAPGLRPEHVSVRVVERRGVPSEVVVAIRGYRIVAPGWSRVLDGKPSAAYPITRAPGDKITRNGRVLSNLDAFEPLANSSRIAYNENTDINPQRVSR